MLEPEQPSRRRYEWATTLSSLHSHERIYEDGVPLAACEVVDRLAARDAEIEKLEAEADLMRRQRDALADRVVKAFHAVNRAPAGSDPADVIAAGIWGDDPWYQAGHRADLAREGLIRISTKDITDG